MTYSSYLGDVPDPAELREILARANRFTLEELAENRSGRIASSQMISLATQALRPFWSALMVLGGWLLFLLVIRTFIPGFLLRVASLTLGKSVTAMFIIITLGCLGAVLFGFFRSGSRTIRLISDLSQGRAACMEGRVWAARRGENSYGMDKLHSEKLESFHYVLNNEYFEVRDLVAWEALAPRELYRLYYAPKSKLLLSIEPVSSTQQAVTGA